ncbi:MAG: hypothetical protein OEW04_09615 [Nitrospirota bacterium]|nr:hypothetical protein [Nitrospirota bacterium]
MQNRKPVLSLILMFVLFACACSFEPDMDRGKFKKVSGAAQAVKSSLSEGASYEQFGRSLEALSNEIAALEGKVATRKEEELIKAYTTLSEVYQDGHTLWRVKLEFVPFGIVPEGRIYVSQDVEPIVFKYSFPVETHLYKPTGKQWKSISEDAIRIIWRNADSQHKIIGEITDN